MWWVIATLIFVGILLMVIEMLLIPGVGVAGILSIASLAASCWYAFTYSGKTAGIITTCIVTAVLIVMVIIILRAKTWKRFALNTEIKEKTNEAVLRVSVGQKGKTLTRLAPVGSAMFGALQVEVKSADNSMVDAGTEIEVVRLEDNKVIVETIK